VNRVFLAAICGVMGVALPCLAQDFPMSNPVIAPTPFQTFDGTGSKTTDPFSIQDKWTITWQGPSGLKVTIYSMDKTPVASITGMGGGSLSLATGGTYYLEIEGRVAPTLPQQQQQQQQQPSSGLGSIDDPLPNSNNGQPQQRYPNGNPNGAPYGNPNGNPYGNPNGRPFDPSVMQAQFYTWHVSIFGQEGSGGPQVAAAGAAAPGATNGAANAAPLPPAKLTADQARAVVLIKGDNAEGTGFLIKTPDGPFVVTNLHVIANNPNIKITTSAGATITMLSAKGASDRDLAMLAIKDEGYGYLDCAADISKTVQPGDEVITPGNSQGGEVMLNTSGKVLGIGPERVEFDNPIYHGNSGGPVFHVSSAKVLGVVTEAMPVDLSNSLDKASFASRQSAISSKMRYFGLRLDTVPSWVPLDWNRFQAETAFLDNFDKQSRSLDSYLNRPDPNQNQNQDQSSQSSSTDTNLYLQDKKIQAARASFHQQNDGSDGAQQVQAFRELLFDLDGIADSDMTAIQNLGNFYSFDQEQAKDETAYRKALRSELDDIGNDVGRMNGLARTSNDQ
jgi:hypothetical protein